jgi:hypothetical protein
MRRIFAAVAFLGLVAALAAHIAGPASGITRPQTLSLLEVPGPFTPLEGLSETAPPVPGARFAFTDFLYRWDGRERGARVGRLEALCTFAKINRRTGLATLHCTVSAYLPAGQIVVTGFFRESPNRPLSATLPVVGGTGAYSNARGQVRVRDIGPPRRGYLALVFRLTP